MNYFREDPRRAIGAVLLAFALIGPFTVYLPWLHAAALGVAGLLLLYFAQDYQSSEDDESIRAALEKEELDWKDEAQYDLRPFNTDFVRIAQNHNYALIEIWSEALRSLGIPTEIRDDFAGSMLFQFSLAVGEIKLLVPAEFAEEAIQCLQGMESVEGIPPAESQHGPGGSESEAGKASAPGYELRRCPVCGSTNLKYAGEISPLMITSLVALNVGLPIKRRKNLCLKCSHRWSDDGADDVSDNETHPEATS